ncbi:short-chain dehydrogenase/reductase SDR [Paenibacillus curdlanolyticus YK9]|uniref:Short-chain dehydrogenase/reductase SDR n=1 Tax=Paenibacillus curdlanolyticus YK9 TaxID=717606 RepID=E0IGM9_9BACL|nr:SDR family NAD(P)-dependent oxidoreductase [Paenibacillus curdlanolyticus]EFM08374.1 short-chain dehydrogenase/reductase SDR [Paenibacillus curdlanolyticus YK9]
MEPIREAFVTGADRGVGFALVKGLLAKGYKVWAGQFAESNVDLQELQGEHGEWHRLLRLDISNAENVRQAIEAISAETDRIDLLINNGAILGDIASTVQNELDFEKMETVYRGVNTLGALRMSSGLIDFILNSTDKLIMNISSEAGSIGASNRASWYAYCMSKAALNMRSKLIHNQISPQGGKVLFVHPGHVQTWMQRKLDASGVLTPGQSAEHILRLVEQRLSPEWTDSALSLIDNNGDTLPW